jgi:exopolysaccharide transport family protein
MTKHDQNIEMAEGGGGPGLGDILTMAARRWRMIATIATVVSVAGIAILMTIPNRYEASATVQIDPRKRTIVQIENVQSDLKTETPIVESEVEVLKSRTVIGRVIDELNLRQDPEFIEPSLLERIGVKLGLKLFKDAPARERLGEPVARDPIAHLITSEQIVGTDPKLDKTAAIFSEKLKVTRVRNSLLIEIKFTAKDPVKAARIANTIAEAYIRDQIDSKVRATTGAIEVLEQKLEGLRRQLIENEQKVARFKIENNIVDTEGQLLSEKQLARLMEETVRARNVSAEAKAKYDQVRALTRRQGDSSAVGDVLASHTVRMLKEQHSKIKRQQAELLTRYGQRHPAMQKINAEAREIEAKIEEEAAQIVVNLKTEYEVAAERERQLTETLDQLKSKQADSREDGVKLRQLEREAQSSKQVFESFLARYKQTVETQTIQVADSRIIERADVPLLPSAPKRKPLMAGIVLLGLALGFGVAFLQEMLVPGLRRPEQLERLLQANHLASIPRLEDATASTSAGSTRLAITRPRSLFAEAVGAARHEIDQQWQSAGPRVILVASALPGEGATLFAANLAHHYAVSGSRTLLLDADMRTAHLTKTLGLNGRAGLREALAGYMTPEATVLRDNSTGLCVIPATSGAPQRTSAPEALASHALAHAFAILKGRFDVIIVDAPPLLPVVDARLVAEHADQVVMTMTWLETPAELTKKAIKLLGYNAEKICGVVFNQVDPEEIQRDMGLGEAAAMPRQRRAA